MTGSLDGCRAKIGRAKEHLNTLEQELASFSKTDPSTLVRDIEEHSTHNVYTFRLQNIPYTRWGLIIGDCVHNMRSALDHITWALANLAPSVPVHDRATQFPIYADRTLFDNMGKRAIKRLPARASTLIERLQPYHRSNPTRAFLWVLHELDAADKHKTITLLGYITPRARAHFVPTPTVPPVIEVFHGPLEDQAPVARLTVMKFPDRPYRRKVQMNIHLGTEIVFGKGTVCENAPVSRILAVLLRRVERIADLFEGFIRRHCTVSP